MTEVCPVNQRKVNEGVARINAFFTLSICCVYLFSGNILLLFLLVYDFFLRGYRESRYSVLSQLSKIILSIIKTGEKFIDAGPKEFAAKIGFMMTIFIVLLNFFDLTAFSFAICAILTFFSVLEFFFGICVACKLYPFYNAIIEFTKFAIKTSK